MYPNEVASMDKRHNWELRRWRRCEWSENIEEETVFTDALGTEEAAEWKLTWQRLRAAWGISGRLENTRPRKRWSEKHKLYIILSWSRQN